MKNIIFSVDDQVFPNNQFLADEIKRERKGG